ncbi:MAG: TRAP transporter large permease subunit, partial [Pseudomonadales bacterium]
DTVSVGDLFAGALLPGLLLVGLYLAYTMIVSPSESEEAPGRLHRGESDSIDAKALATSLLPPLALIITVLGAILGGFATPTEAAGVGAFGAMLLALGYRTLDVDMLGEVCRATLKTTSMVFFILIGASLFSLVFRGYGGDEMVMSWFVDLPGGTWSALLLVLAVIFLLGFMLDFIEITFVVIPIVGPILLGMGIDPVWLGVLIAVNLQTSFLTPPFGFALFYLRGVTPPEIPTTAIYRGVIPFIALQLLLLAILLAWPGLATWLPEQLYD